MGLMQSLIALRSNPGGDTLKIKEPKAELNRWKNLDTAQSNWPEGAILTLIHAISTLILTPVHAMFNADLNWF